MFSSPAEFKAVDEPKDKTKEDDVQSDELFVVFFVPGPAASLAAGRAQCRSSAPRKVARKKCGASIYSGPVYINTVQRVYG